MFVIGRHSWQGNMPANAQTCEGGRCRGATSLAECGAGRDWWKVSLDRKAGHKGPVGQANELGAAPLGSRDHRGFLNWKTRPICVEGRFLGRALRTGVAHEVKQKIRLLCGADWGIR